MVFVFLFFFFWRGRGSHYGAPGFRLPPPYPEIPSPPLSELGQIEQRRLVNTHKSTPIHAHTEQIYGKYIVAKARLVLVIAMLKVSGIV